MTRLKDLFPLIEQGDIEIKGMTADSRRVAPGYLFAALKGTVSDGRDYIPKAASPSMARRM